MQTLQIEKTNAITAYNKADKSTRQLLVDLFGKENLSLKPTDRIKTFEDACDDQGILPADALPYKAAANKDEEALNAVAKLFIIAKSLNEGWKADFANQNQYKYYPWFKHRSGSGLSFDVTGNWHTHTNVGFRLCFKDEETAEYAGTQFIEIYKQFLL